VTECLICPEDAGHRYACHGCVNRMRKQLRELEDYAVILACTMGPLRGGPSRRSPGYGSRSPARDDVIVALDVRSRAGDVDEDGEAITRRPEDRDTWTRSIPGAIRQLACWLREEADQSDPVRWTLTTEIAYILGRIEACAMEQWVDDLASDIKELHAQARVLAGDPSPRPLGTCMVVECGGDVYRFERPGLDGAQCRSCQRLYDGLDLLRLGAAAKGA
jgi:hypothetical protein